MNHTPRSPIRALARRGLLPVLLLAPLVAFALLFFGLSYLVTPEPDIDVEPGIGLARVDGREVVLVPYGRSGARGMFQLMTRDMFQARVAALDVATGEVLWDTQVSDELIWHATVLAAGDKVAYVTTDAGLLVFDTHTGEITARGPDIAGLGSAYVAAPSAYGYDAANHRVMAMTATGAVLAIPLDNPVAAPVDPATATTWAAELTVDGHTKSKPQATATKATIDTGRLELRDRGAPGKVLVRVGADGEVTPVGDTVYFDAALVTDGAARAVGSGHVLVRHDRSVNDNATVLTAVALDNGTTTSTLPIGSSPDSAATGPDGTVAITTDHQVAVLTADGHLTALTVGATDFFGSSS
ncbi:PA2928 family protein [Actinokineospora inagensis]|uniref:PA2928 family protein n=1 Tax=Actinokineospora inagensis TaxID=103730 RepID=UPI0004144662|nr:PA2928 family protein [Actinokineospora inagensis]